MTYRVFGSMLVVLSLSPLAFGQATRMDLFSQASTTPAATDQSSTPPPAPRSSMLPYVHDQISLTNGAAGSTTAAPAPAQQSCGSGCIPAGADNACGSSCGPIAWFTGEYLLWRVKDAYIPCLSTTGTAYDGAKAGAIGQYGTSEIMGPGDQDLGWFSGLRLGTGVWLCDCWGLEGSFLYLGERSTTARISANNGQVIAVPFQLGDGSQDSYEVACSTMSGSVSYQLTTKLYGAEVNLLRAGGCSDCCGCGSSGGSSGGNSCGGCGCCNGGFNWLLGFRYLELDESLSLCTTDTLLQTNTYGTPSQVAGALTSTNDQFATHNHFYGTQVGTQFDWCRGRWSLDATAKVALGPIDQEVDICGSTTQSVPGNTATTTKGGIFAQPSNNGSHDSVGFAVAPEVDINIDFAITGRVHAMFGYSFIYLSDVVRPGDQIDKTIDFAGQNTSSVYGPFFNRQTTNFWAQGLNFGLECRF